jgi:hypothetical protein
VERRGGFYMGGKAVRGFIFFGKRVWKKREYTKFL